jgi:hypothetical protein
MFCSSQVHLEVSQYGDYRVYDFGKWRNSYIVSDQEATNHLSYFPEAVASPNKFILIEEEKRILRFEPVFKKVLSIERKGIIYSDDEKRIRFIEAEEKKKESSYLLLFSMTSIFLMLLASLIYRKNDISSIAIILHFGAVLTAVLAIFAAAFISYVMVVLSFFVAMFIVATMFFESRAEKILLALYYLSMIAYFAVAFIGV